MQYSSHLLSSALYPTRRWSPSSRFLIAIVVAIECVSRSDSAFGHVHVTGFLVLNRMQYLLFIFLAVLSVLQAQANSGDGPSLARRCTDRWVVPPYDCWDVSRRSLIPSKCSYGNIRHLVSSHSCCASPKFLCQSLGLDEGTYTSLSLRSLHWKFIKMCCSRHQIDTAILRRTAGL